VADPDLLEPGERERIERACNALEEAARGADPRLVHASIEGLDDATKAFAGRRMNRAIARAIEGRRVDVVEKTVEHAKGIEEAHATGGPQPARAGGAR
jgi:molecular chaperone HscA